MSKLSIVLLPFSENQLNIIGEKKPSSGYYGYSSGLHTISFSLNNFTGRIFIQGSMVNNPTDNDWFNIVFDGNDYIEYENETSTTAKSFVVNMLWIRVKIDRTYLQPQPLNTADVGYIRKILVNY